MCTPPKAKLLHPSMLNPSFLWLFCLLLKSCGETHAFLLLITLLTLLFFCCFPPSAIASVCFLVNKSLNSSYYSASFPSPSTAIIATRALSKASMMSLFTMFTKSNSFSPLLCKTSHLLFFFYLMPIRLFPSFTHYLWCLHQLCTARGL